MSLIGFKAQNHPQQTGKHGALDEVDDRGTHPLHFDPIADRFGGFTLDVAAAPHNAKCPRFYTRADDGLTQPWGGTSPDGERRESVWCNPPYSDLYAWVSKAWAEWEKPDGPELIVMLLPANRPEQKWWQELVEPRRDRAGSPLRVEFLPGRMRFIKPGQTDIGPNERPPLRLLPPDLGSSMTAPKRIQQRRTAGWRKPEGAVAVGRGTKWGNPYRVIPVRASGPFDVVRTDGVFLVQATGIETARTIAAERYRHALEQIWTGYPRPSEIRAELAGKDLMCWCPLDQPCHADVLLELANTPEGLPS